MVKHTQTIRRQQPTIRLSVFDHFAALVLIELRQFSQKPSLSVDVFAYPHSDFLSMYQHLDQHLDPLNITIPRIT